MEVTILPSFFHRRPVDASPIIFYLIEKVFRHTAMCEYEFGPTAGSGSKRNCRHRVNALGKIVATPRLNQSSSPREIHVHSSDLPCLSRKLSPDFVADERFATGDFRAFARVGKQVIDGVGWNLESNFMLDGFAHIPPAFFSSISEAFRPGIGPYAMPCMRQPVRACHTR